MVMTQGAEMIDFDELRKRVGASEYRTRVALAVLDLKPAPSPDDARERRYRAEWVEIIRKHLGFTD